MAQTQQGSTGKTASRKATASDSGKAGQLLMQDHRRVLDMFKEYEKLMQGDDSVTRKQELAGIICTELKIHTRIEEELFYPGMRKASESSSLLDEAEVEHASAKQLIKEIESMQPDHKLYDAKIKVLGEYVRHHIKEEEEKMLPEAQRAGVDTAQMAEDLKQRKEELKKQLH